MKPRIKIENVPSGVFKAFVLAGFSRSRALSALGYSPSGKAYRKLDTRLKTLGLEFPMKTRRTNCIRFETLGREDLFKLVRGVSSRTEILKALGYRKSGKAYKKLEARAKQLKVQLPPLRTEKWIQPVIKVPNELIPEIVPIETLSKQDLVNLIKTRLSSSEILKALGQPLSARSYGLLSSRARMFGVSLPGRRFKNPVQPVKLPIGGLTRADLVKLTETWEYQSEILRDLGYTPNPTVYYQLKQRAEKLGVKLPSRRTARQSWAAVLCSDDETNHEVTEPKEVQSFRDLPKATKGLSRKKMITQLEAEIQALSGTIRHGVEAIKKRRKAQALLREME